MLVGGCGELAVSRKTSFYFNDFKKIPSEMEVAPRYKLLALLTWFTLLILLKLFNTATLQIYIVRKG